MIQLILWYYVIGGIIALAAVDGMFSKSRKERHEIFEKIILPSWILNLEPLGEGLQAVIFVIWLAIIMMYPLLGLFSLMIPCVLHNTIPSTFLPAITSLTMYTLSLIAIHLKRKIFPLKQIC